MGPVNSQPDKFLSVDIRKFEGVFEEIARFPLPFEDDKGDRATWKLELKDDSLVIQYTSFDMFGIPREDKEREGKLSAVEENIGKVLLTFPKQKFAEEFRILNMQDENGNYCILVSDDSHVMFILSRKSQLTKQTFAELKTKLEYKYHLGVYYLVENRKAITWN